MVRRKNSTPNKPTPLPIGAEHLKLRLEENSVISVIRKVAKDGGFKRRPLDLFRHPSQVVVPDRRRGFELHPLSRANA
jgi:hypothetical protein